MKNVALPLRRGYYQLLNNLPVNGKQIRFYDKKAIAESETPYIIYQGSTSSRENTKDMFGESTQVTLFVYTSYMGDYGGTELADLITEEIIKKVIPSPGKSGVSATGFNVCMATLKEASDELIDHNTKSTFRKRIVIEHLIYQE